MGPRGHRMLCLAAATVATLAVPGMAAQNYPNRPVRIIVPFPPSGGPDTVARILGNRLTEQLGQPVIVDPRPGGNGFIAVEIAKNAPPDGHTLLLATFNIFAVLPALDPKLPYDAEKDFVALSRVASVANVVAVHASLAVGTVVDLVKLAKARPGPANSTMGQVETAPRHISEARCSMHSRG